jgi:hypothetical protein
VRHNLKIERAALWYAVRLAVDCATVASADEVGELVGSPPARYDTKAAVQTIPTLMPFASHERDALARETRENKPFYNFEWEYAITHSVVDGSALFDRWHDWLWTPDRQSRDPNPVALELAEGCKRLSIALNEVIAVALG